MTTEAIGDIDSSQKGDRPPSAPDEKGQAVATTTVTEIYEGNPVVPLKRGSADDGDMLSKYEPLEKLAAELTPGIVALARGSYPDGSSHVTFFLRLVENEKVELPRCSACFLERPLAHLSKVSGRSPLRTFLKAS